MQAEPQAEPSTEVNAGLRESAQRLWAAAAPVLARLARLAQRCRWARVPLSLALGVRVVVFLLGEVGARLLHLTSLAGPLGIWRKFDAVWYLQIVEQGYRYSPLRASSANFFPLYPMVVWLTQHLLFWLPFSYDTTVLIAGMLDSWVLFGVACALLYRLTLDRFGLRTAYTAVLLLALFPFSFYYGAPFSESLYLALALAAFVAFERQAWGWAGAAALLAGATRPPGLLVGACVVLAYALDWWRTRHPLRLDVLWLALSPLGTAAYLGYCWLRFGDPLAYLKTSEAGWQRGRLQLGGVRMMLDLLRHAGEWLIGRTYSLELNGLIALCILAALVLVIPVARILGAPYALFALGSVVAPLVTYDGVAGMGRYMSVAFPLFLVLAVAVRHRPLLREALLLGSAMFLALFTVLFLSGYALS